ncbi:hypothetical protein J2X12_002917 [Pseudarthrobacter oxydans]|uniref:Uncharacterized protein n=1 Tax=Pseudarthrobacter oxydans TaxID=1671 RepID=A0AAW8NER4_PSEOX|nr:hypothetical protein [Pseudarthrobacter oxydans]MDR6794346.1 hypothetical protein [Pseudarthrobacter oxydans]MDR7164879.1 hypothetical protein [Pseudarthrobacter oxydans]
MPQVTAEASSIRRYVPANLTQSRTAWRNALGYGIADVLDAAITPGGTTDLRQAILTAVYNHDTQSFEIRWDIAK